MVAETCKNLLLAGLSATLQDGAVVSPSDLGANFLLDDEDVGVNVSWRVLCDHPRLPTVEHDELLRGPVRGLLRLERSYGNARPVRYGRTGIKSFVH